MVLLQGSGVGLGAKAGILIVDDQPIAREGLALHVNSQADMRVSAEASTGREAIRILAARLPDLVVADLAIQNLGGFQLIEKMIESRPEVKILVVCPFDETIYATRVLEAGAVGYVSKQSSGEEIVAAARLVIRGGHYLSADMTSQMLAFTTGTKRGQVNLSPLSRLSNRELEVFRMIGEGRTTRQIAENIGLSIHTIESYREKIKTKLSLENSARLTQQATRWVLESCHRGRAPEKPATDM